MNLELEAARVCKSLLASFPVVVAFLQEAKWVSYAKKRTKDSKEERWKVTPQRPYILVDYKIGSVFNIGHGCARCSANTLHTRSRRAGAGGSVKPLSPHLQPSAPRLPGTYSVWRRQNSFQSDAEC